MTIPKQPVYETVLMTDIDVSYPSGPINVTVTPEDSMEIDEATGDITVHTHGQEGFMKFLGKHMEWCRVKVRPHRRAVEKESSPTS